MFQKILLALKSKTAWTSVVMFLVTAIPQIRAFVPVQWQPVLDGFLALLIIVFHINPSQNYDR